MPLSRCHNGFSPPEQLGSCRIFVRHTGCKQRTFRPICRTDSTLQVHISNNKRSRCISFHEYKSTNPGKQHCHSHQGCEKISKRAVPRVAHRHVACKRVTRAAIPLSLLISNEHPHGWWNYSNRGQSRKNTSWLGSDRMQMRRLSALIQNMKVWSEILVVAFLTTSQVPI